MKIDVYATGSAQLSFKVNRYGVAFIIESTNSIVCAYTCVHLRIHEHRLFIFLLNVYRSNSNFSISRCMSQFRGAVG